MNSLKKVFTTSVALSLILAMAIAFSGCGGPETLEEYVNSDDDAKATIESLSSSGMTIDITGNTLTYTYAYSQTYDAATIEAMEEQIESAMDSMESTFESIGDTLEEESGIDDITVKVVYEDGAGTVIFSEDY